MNTAVRCAAVGDIGDVNIVFFSLFIITAPSGL